MQLPSIREANVEGKRVFVRADLDVPLVDGVIEDDTRLKAGLPTIEYLLNHGAKVIIAGHLGRPKQGLMMKDEGLTLEPVAQWLVERFNDLNHLSKTQIDGFFGWQIRDNLFLLENLRFYEGEEKNDPEFGKKLASLADIYVNDAFSVAHRSHASTFGIAALLPHYVGLRLEEEVKVLSGVLENPKRPLVVIIGGAKVETKLSLVQKMLSYADYVLVGGKLPKEGDELKKLTSEKLVVADLTSDGTDISSESATQFVDIINKAKTIVWNGPLGFIKEDNVDTERGTREVATAIAQIAAYKIVGGGDTIDYLQRLGIIDKFDFVSTGGGAMLAFLSGEKLPGLEALLA